MCILRLMSMFEINQSYINGDTCTRGDVPGAMYEYHTWSIMLLVTVRVRVRVTRRRCQILLSSIQNPLNSPFNIFQDM